MQYNSCILELGVAFAVVVSVSVFHFLSFHNLEFLYRNLIKILEHISSIPSSHSSLNTFILSTKKSKSRRKKEERNAAGRESF
jgi:hypothetical protein